MFLIILFSQHLRNVEIPIPLCCKKGERGALKIKLFSLFPASDVVKSWLFVNVFYLVNNCSFKWRTGNIRDAACLVFLCHSYRGRGFPIRPQGLWLFGQNRHQIGSFKPISVVPSALSRYNLYKLHELVRRDIGGCFIPREPKANEIKLVYRTVGRAGCHFIWGSWNDQRCFGFYHWISWWLLRMRKVVLYTVASEPRYEQVCVNLWQHGL